MLPVVVNWCPVADLSSHSRSSGFSTQAVGQTLMTHRCRSFRIDQEIVSDRNRFLFRYRIHPLCRVGWYLTALIRLYQHSSDRWFRLCALSWRTRSLQRCSVLRILSILASTINPSSCVPNLCIEGSIQQSTRFLTLFLPLPLPFLCPVRLCCIRLPCLLPLPFFSPLPFLPFPPLPSIERSMGTASPAAVSACARQYSNSIVLACA